MHTSANNNKIEADVTIVDGTHLTPSDSQLRKRYYMQLMTNMLLAKVENTKHEA